MTVGRMLKADPMIILICANGKCSSAHRLNWLKTFISLVQLRVSEPSTIGEAGISIALCIAK